MAPTDEQRELVHAQVEELLGRPAREWCRPERLEGGNLFSIATEKLGRETAELLLTRGSGGEFTMGSNEHYPEEAPAHRVSVNRFWMDATAVTNAEFDGFLEETGYTTVAERPLDPADFPGAPPENLVPGSLVFTATPGPVDLRHLSHWWTWTPGACWKRPEGPNSSLAGREDHPVVHVAYADAQAYAAWAGKELPTEAQWELAAPAGLDGAAYTWGTTSEQEGQRLANYWHGDFAWRPEPGYGTTAPVGSYPPNAKVAGSNPPPTRHARRNRPE